MPNLSLVYAFEILKSSYENEITEQDNRM